MYFQDQDSIGGSFENSQSYTGTISNVLMFTESLSEEQIGIFSKTRTLINPGNILREFTGYGKTGIIIQPGIEH